MAIPSASVSADERLTTVGLLFESSAGLRRMFGRQLEEAGVHTPQSFDILIRLARSEGNELRMSELAAQASLTPSGLTRAVDRLQDQGFVVRRSCPEDRRGSFAQLTHAGKQLMADSLPGHVAQVNRVLEDVFSPDEMEQFSTMLRRLRDYTRAQNASAGCTGADEVSDPCTEG
jgi:MarR family 2-MHQ and catechol resistance regulon transcriptional repressor